MLAVAEESGCQVVSPRAGEHMAFAGEERWPLPYFAPGFTWKTKAQPERRWWTTGRYHGGCCLIETTLLERLIARDGEFLHEPLFMYWDEWDTSIRAARLGARFAVANVPVKHYSPGRNSLPGLRETRLYYSSRNSMLMARRHFPWWQRPVLATLQASRSLGYYCVLKREPMRVYLRGLFDGLRGRSGIWDRHPR
jgi:GT2 family glycosyltransferase